MNPSILRVIAVLAAACTSVLPVDDRACPCAPGNACQVSDNICVPYQREATGSSAFRCQRDVPECTVPEEFVVDTFKSSEDLSRYLVGRWLWCGTDGPEPTAMGIELTDDGRFHLLHRNAQGECERSFGFDRAWSWSIEDISEQNPDGTYQVNMRWDGAGVGSIVPAFSARPHKLRNRGPAGFGMLVADPQ